jgi:hypothetical protein
MQHADPKEQAISTSQLPRRLMQITFSTSECYADISIYYLQNAIDRLLLALKRLCKRSNRGLVFRTSCISCRTSLSLRGECDVPEQPSSSFTFELPSRSGSRQLPRRLNVFRPRHEWQRQQQRPSLDPGLRFGRTSCSPLT